MSKLENCSHKLKIWKHAHRAIAGRSVLLYILSLVIRISTFGREERDNRNLLTTWAGNMENRGYYTVVNVKFKTGRKTFSVLISLHLTPKFKMSVCPRVATKQTVSLWFVSCLQQFAALSRNWWADAGWRWRAPAAGAFLALIRERCAN